MNFCHLHNHSEFSQLDGYGNPKQYIQRAKELQQTAIACTDHGNIDGTIKWQRECKKQGIRSIIGCELYIVPDMLRKDKKEKRGHITVLVKGVKGWQLLLTVLSKANIDGFYRRPRIDYQSILTANIEGLKELVFFTGCSSSFLLSDGGRDLFYKMIDMKLDLYLEVMPHRIDSQKVINELCLDLHRKTKISLVATNDSHYVMEDQWKVQEVLLAIQRKDTWNNPKRWKFGFKGLHLRSSGEMIDEFDAQSILTYRQYYMAMVNTGIIADKCGNFEIPKLGFDLPLSKYERDGKETADELLDFFCRSDFFEGHGKIEWNDEYERRYKDELELIKKKKFARYFLIIYELVQWAKQQGVPIGPGRGSVGGSLISYILGITQVDPLKYDLLFERFISEDRIDWPDIDLDFADNKCHLIREHLEDEYGKYHVSGISTFLRLKSKAAVRDVGRVFELPVKDIDIFAKSIRVGEHEDGIIANAGQNTKEGEYFSDKYPDEFKMSCALEGQVRGSGQHPAGLIISGEDLRKCGRTNLCLRTGTLVANWDMEDCDYSGLIKIDVLKLGTLTVLQEAKRLIGDDSFDYENLPLDDSKVFEMLSSGDTAGIFQLSGYDCQKLCIEMGVDNLEDIAAIGALARPGPKDSGQTQLYGQRKKGEKWNPFHSLYEKITEKTYGVIVYQEQVMKVMTDIAGFSNSDADRIRKVIGKKRKVEEFEPYREAFLNGCREKKTLNEKQANEFWQGLLNHAHYSFNRSHAIAYALIGYQTAYVKYHYPVEFYCAQLTYGADKENTLKAAQAKGFQIVTPKVGISDSIRWIAKDNNLYMPFIEIKGIGEKEAIKCNAIKQIVKRKGFFNLKDAPVSKTKVDQLLYEIKAYDSDPRARPKNCFQYFQYEVSERRG